MALESSLGIRRGLPEPKGSQRFAEGCTNSFCTKAAQETSVFLGLQRPRHLETPLDISSNPQTSPSSKPQHCPNYAQGSKTKLRMLREKITWALFPLMDPEIGSTSCPKFLDLLDSGFLNFIFCIN